MRTLPEVLNQLKQLDEIELVELLGINSEDLTNKFVDLIEEDVEKFDLALNQWFDEEEDGTEEN